MFKEAIEFIINLGQPEIIELDQEKKLVSTKIIHPIKNPPIIPLISCTLSSIVDFIAAHPTPEYIINILSYREIHLMTSDLDKWNRRETLLKTNADIDRNDSSITKKFTVEELMIHLKTDFIQTAKIEELIHLLGNISSTDVKNLSDDGWTQTVETKKAIHHKEHITLPPISVLEKIRTFVEIKQPSSYFLIRLKEESGEIKCSIHETLNSEWKIEAIRRIKKYLEVQFEEAKLTRVSIIG